MPGKGAHSGLWPRKTVCPNPRGFDEGFYNSGSKAGKSLTRSGCEQGLHFLNLISGGRLLILISFSGPFNLASGGFLAAPPLISNCLESPFGTQGRSWRLESCLQEMVDRTGTSPVAQWNLPANAGDAGLSPGPGRSHMPRSD